MRLDELTAAEKAQDRAAAPDAPPPPRPSPVIRLLRLWRRVGRNRRVRWTKKVFTFPIGERFAAISIAAAFFDAKVTFIVLLVWGGVAGAYIVAGRVLRSVRSKAFIAPAGQGPGRLETYRDDGPLARLLGRAFGAAVPLTAEVLALVALLAVLAGAVIGGDGASKLAAGLLIGAALLAGGVSAGRPHRDRLRWLVPPALRIVEFAGITWLATIADATTAGDSTLPAAFALLCAISFRHYDNVYRLRQRGEDAADFIPTFGLGWDGRLLLSFVLVVAAAVPAGLWVAAVALATLFVGEAVHGWMTFNRTNRVPVYDDEEEEAE
jgi:hypothetical protein